MKFARYFPALVVALCPTVTQADTLVQEFHLQTDTPSVVNNWHSGTSPIQPYFDPALGTLTQVDVNYSFSAGGT